MRQKGAQRRKFCSAIPSNWGGGKGDDEEREGIRYPGNPPEPNWTSLSKKQRGDEGKIFRVRGQLSGLGRSCDNAGVSIQGISKKS